MCRFELPAKLGVGRSKRGVPGHIYPGDKRLLVKFTFFGLSTNDSQISWFCALYGDVHPKNISYTLVLSVGSSRVYDLRRRHYSELTALDQKQRENGNKKSNISDLEN